MRRARQQAAQRRRRVIFNNDGDDGMYGVTGATVVEFCKENAVEVFWTLRMNDIHDSFTEKLLSQWKKEHPEFLLGNKSDGFTWPQAPRQDGGTKKYWSFVDFAHPEVRDLCYETIADVARRYDVDGIDLDFFRDPLFFLETFEGRPVNRAHVEMITDLVRRVRRMILRESARRGRPLLLSVRVPMTEFHALTRCGLDIRSWLREGLVDILVTGGGYVPMSMPTEVMVKLGHRYGVPVYPTISGSGVRSRVPGGQLSASGVEGWRGAAANALLAGADGILSFNIFPNGADTEHSRFVAGVWNDMGDPDSLAHKTKLFAVENILNYYNSADLTHGIPLQGRCPLSVSATTAQEVELFVGYRG